MDSLSARMRGRPSDKIASAASFTGYSNLTISQSIFSVSTMAKLPLGSLSLGCPTDPGLSTNRSSKLFTYGTWVCPRIRMSHPVPVSSPRSTASSWTYSSGSVGDPWNTATRLSSATNRADGPRADRNLLAFCSSRSDVQIAAAAAYGFILDTSFEMAARSWFPVTNHEHSPSTLEQHSFGNAPYPTTSPAHTAMSGDLSDIRIDAASSAWRFEWTSAMTASLMGRSP